MTAPSGTDEAPDTELGRHMDDRRNDLGLTWDDVAKLSGLSRQTLYDLRKGKSDYSRMRSSTKRKLEKALQLERGAVDAKISGARAPDRETAPVEISAEAKAELTDEEKVRLRVLIDMIKPEDLTPELRFALLQYLFQSGGVELTPDRLRAWLQEPHIRMVEQSAAKGEPEQAT